MNNLQRLLEEREVLIEKRNKIQKEVKRLNNAISQAKYRQKQNKVVI